MIAESVSRKKLDRILKTQAKMKPCPVCGSYANIIIKLPFYASGNISVVCEHCGNKVKTRNLSAVYSSGNTFATPITFRSIMRAISTTVSEWNQQEQAGQQ